MSNRILATIERDVHRLALATTPHAGHLTRVTRVPLLTELREAVRPDQGSTGSGRAASSSTRVPIDPDALTLYNDIADSISSMYTTATDRSPHGTPEQLLISWWITFITTPGKTDVMLTNYADRLSAWRRRIENHFTRPRELTLGACPNCGYTHHHTIANDEVIIQRTLVGSWWPDHPERGTTVHCRHCKAMWTDNPQHPEAPSLDDLDKLIRLVVTASDDIDDAEIDTTAPEADNVRLTDPGTDEEHARCTTCGVITDTTPCRDHQPTAWVSARRTAWINERSGS